MKQWIGRATSNRRKDKAEEVMIGLEKGTDRGNICVEDDRKERDRDRGEAKATGAGDDKMERQETAGIEEEAEEDAIGVYFRFVYGESC